MNFNELRADQVFRFVEEELDTYDYIKLDDTTFVHANTFEVVNLDDEVFDGIIDRVEVEAWDPDREIVKRQEELRAKSHYKAEKKVRPVTQTAYYEGDSVSELIELVENYYFPDYELVAVRGEDRVKEFTIHCWRTHDTPELHRTSVWYDGEHVMDTTRESIELILSSPEMLHDIFGEIV